MKIILWSGIVCWLLGSWNLKLNHSSFCYKVIISKTEIRNSRRTLIFITESIPKIIVEFLQSCLGYNLFSGSLLKINHFLETNVHELTVPIKLLTHSKTFWMYFSKYNVTDGNTVFWTIMYTVYQYKIYRKLLYRLSFASFTNYKLQSIHIFVM